MTGQNEEPTEMDLDNLPPSLDPQPCKYSFSTTFIEDEDGDDSPLHPSFELAQTIHRLLMISNGSLSSKYASTLGIPSDLEENVKCFLGKDRLENPGLYRHLRSILKWKREGKYCLSDDQLDTMENKHKETLVKMETEVKEAETNAGDMEVLNARWKVAKFSAKSLSKAEALDAYTKVLELPKLSSGKRLDMLIECSHVASFYGDRKKNMEVLEKIAKLADDVGDWERRNRLKVHNALSKLDARDFKSASPLLLDGMATFSCEEICPYRDFLAYAILCNTLYLPRRELKSRIIDGSEIRTLSQDFPQVSKLVNSLYECNYKEYFYAIIDIEPFLIADRFLQPHAGFLLRELYVLGYKQFLDAYKSVTLKSMSSTFGVGTEFLDIQLGRFISAGRLAAKIDKVASVVETNRPDQKNEQYKNMIREGDLLLNRIQKLSRVIDL